MEDKENQRIEEQERLRKKDFPEKEDGKECPQCHTINNLEAMFCEECGYEFKEEKKDKKCSKCGTINNLEAKFCEECGCEFGGSAQDTRVQEHKKQEQQTTSVPEEEKKEEVKLEIQEAKPKKKKRSFFTDTQLESIRKSNDEMKEKQITSVEETITDVKEVEIGGVKLICIPAGEFLMGSPDGEGEGREHPQHKVYLDAYCMGKYQVTNKEFSEFLNNYGKDTDDDGNNMIYDSNDRNSGRYNWGLRKSGGKWIPQSGYDNHPVIYVTWYGSVQYCKWLSQKTGINFRLPTEAEWERACRAGANTRYCFGDDDSRLGEYAWYNANSEGHTHPVGQKKQNSWGLYDMHGNVWEWCRDWFGQDYYKDSPTNNPEGSLSGSYRGRRGGDWDYYAGRCRCARRSSYSPSSSNYNLGFRPAKALK